MIYFITAPTVGLVKIGYAKNPQARAVSIRSHSPVPIYLERVGTGSREEERALHKRFQHLQRHGEWFALNSEIRLVMRSFDKHEWRYRRGSEPADLRTGAAA
ncbi:MAG: hypothetical protein CMK96_09655 [Pseudomonas sp.]|jgi:hypothetical protein|nr:hypothetical protein [Pseudomonas sp.]|tara:strand:+ start:793 stop:1098 length:306 start_codon:yes stop_codon:yes gene_type:complete